MYISMQATIKDTQMVIEHERFSVSLGIQVIHYQEYIFFTHQISKV